ncbi:TlpA family protein disulfide reductase [Fodinicola acaciae]|uniref:TlpA family protein disulfide reductase n=1 Tax=Fodinicola acaciae TaxID=2681555 RepID=UPI0013D4FA2E|nr:hypothetical protein [Fodinicola acaciae]
MPAVVALVILLTVLCLLNLALVFGLLRRIRDIESRISSDQAATEPLLAVGAQIDDFEAVTTDGELLRRESLADGTLVGFFDPQCESCHENLPHFAAAARTQPRVRSLAVIRDDEEQEEMVSALSGVSRVVVERRRGPVARAFHVHGTPAFCRLGADQRISAHGYATPALA